MARLGNGTISLSGEFVNKKKRRENYESVFLGTGGRHFFMMLGTLLLSLIPFVGLPNAICIRRRWYARRTKIVGMQLRFEGKAGALLGRFFVWGFFSIITLGIYALVLLPVRYRQWMTKYTVFEQLI